MHFYGFSAKSHPLVFPFPYSKVFSLSSFREHQQRPLEIICRRHVNVPENLLRHYTEVKMITAMAVLQVVPRTLSGCMYVSEPKRETSEGLRNRKVKMRPGM